MAHSWSGQSSDITVCVYVLRMEWNVWNTMSLLLHNFSHQEVAKWLALCKWPEQREHHSGEIRKGESKIGKRKKREGSEKAIINNIEPITFPLKLGEKGSDEGVCFHSGVHSFIHWLVLILILCTHTDTDTEADKGNANRQKVCRECTNRNNSHPNRR